MKTSKQLTAHQSMIRRNGLNQTKIMALKDSFDRGKKLVEEVNTPLKLSIYRNKLLIFDINDSDNIMEISMGCDEQSVLLWITKDEAEQIISHIKNQFGL
jgi:hypothetical protein